MLWECCEFRGGNRVQRGKYPGFQTDSEALFVRVLSPSRHAGEMEPKKASRERLGGSVPDPSRSPSRGKIAGQNRRPDGCAGKESAKTRAAVERISSRDQSILESYAYSDDVPR